VSLLYEVVDPASGGLTQAFLDWSTPNLPTRHAVRAQETEAAVNGGSSLDHAVLRYQSDAPSYGLDDNFHLQSAFGSYKPLTQSFTKDAATSQALDAGDQTSPLPRSSHPTVDALILVFEGNTATLLTRLHSSSSCSHSMAVRRCARVMLRSSAGALQELGWSISG